MLHRHLLTNDRDPMADQSADSTRLQLGEPLSFIWVTYRNIGERVTYSLEMIQKTAATPNSTLAWVRAHKNWKLESCYTAYRKLDRLDRVFFK